MYEKEADQVFNNPKSSNYFSSNTSTLAKQSILQTTWSTIFSNYDKYLGLPTFFGRSKYNTFYWIKKKV